MLSLLLDKYMLSLVTMFIVEVGPHYLSLLGCVCRLVKEQTQISGTSNYEETNVENDENRLHWK